VRLTNAIKVDTPPAEIRELVEDAYRRTLDSLAQLLEEPARSR
jgi:hypothetical protein